MSQPTSTPGWYPDPSGAYGLRFFDGVQWTAHLAPHPPAAPAVAVAVANSGGGGGASVHVLHAVLTFFSCGLWLPIWIVFIVIDVVSASNRRSTAVSIGGFAPAPAPHYVAPPPPRPVQPVPGPPAPPGPVQPRPRSSTGPDPGKVVLIVMGALGVGFVALLLLALIVAHPVLLFLAIPATGVGSVLFWRYRTDKLKVFERYRRDVVAARADTENTLWHEGDPRGTYGHYPPTTEEETR
jgi:hypothetical protein